MNCYLIFPHIYIDILARLASAKQQFDIFITLCILDTRSSVDISLIGYIYMCVYIYIFRFNFFPRCVYILQHGNEVFKPLNIVISIFPTSKFNNTDNSKYNEIYVPFGIMTCLVFKSYQETSLFLQQQHIQYIPRNMHMVFALLCFVVVIHWLIFPISIRLTSLALWQSNDCPSASKATLMNMDKYFMWIHYERLHNHNKAKHNKTVCIFLGIYCMY